MVLLDITLYKHTIGVLSKEVWNHTAFGPTIHRLLPRITFTKPQFQLWDRLVKLLPKYVASPQWTVAIDMVLICDLGAPARFSTTAKLIRAPNLESSKLCLGGGGRYF
jgi:hypothetical protein